MKISFFIGFLLVCLIALFGCVPRSVREQLDRIEDHEHSMSALLREIDSNVGCENHRMAVKR